MYLRFLLVLCFLCNQFRRMQVSVFLSLNRFLKHMCNMYIVYVSSDGVQDWQTQDSCVPRCIIFAYV